MSIINQMLVDLEARRAADQPAVNARRIAYAGGALPRHGARRASPVVLWAIAVAMAGAAVFLIDATGYRDLIPLFDRVLPRALAGGQPAAAPARRTHPAEESESEPSHAGDGHPTGTLAAQATPAAPPAVADVPPPEPAATPVVTAERKRPEREAAATLPPARARPDTQAAPATGEARQPKASAAVPQGRMVIVPRQPTMEARFTRNLAEARNALARGDTASAHASVQRALDLAPANAAAAELLVAIDLRRGDTAAAVATLQEVLARDPRNAAFAQTLARLLAARGESAQAARYMRNALSNGRGDGGYLALLAALESRMGEHSAAAAHYLEALALNRAQAAWWLGLGMALEQLQRPGEARAAFAEAQRIGGLDRQVSSFIEQRVAALDAAAAR